MQTAGTAVAADCLFTPGTGTQSCFEEAEVDNGRATDEALVERARGGDSLAFGEKAGIRPLRLLFALGRSLLQDTGWIDRYQDSKTLRIGGQRGQ